MNTITEIALENIRCFAAKQTVSLPRIAILVGENSTGKSTFLACCSALAELSCNEKIDRYDPFNVTPFNLGTFETIARHGRNHLTLAGRIGGMDLSFQFVSENSKPSEHVAAIQPRKAPELKFERINSASGEIWRLASPSYDFRLDAREISYHQFSQWLGTAIRRRHFPYERDLEAFKQRANPSQDQIDQFPRLLNHFVQISENLLESKPVLYAIPPHINTPFRLNEKIPLVTSIDEFNQINDHLRQAGGKLKLFSQINITSMPEGYALEVTIRNRTHSIVDAGFGVHSVLPHLKAIVNNSSSTVLMQQPETHLHPMAQALLSQLIAESRGHYIIETHADHIINRLSICIRKKEINHEDVAIFWFENKGNEAVIHRIDFDEEGNLINAPPNYREFFINERKDFLGFE